MLKRLGRYGCDQLLDLIIVVYFLELSFEMNCVNHH